MNWCSVCRWRQCCLGLGCLLRHSLDACGARTPCAMSRNCNLHFVAADAQRQQRLLPNAKKKVAPIIELNLFSFLCAFLPSQQNRFVESYDPTGTVVLKISNALPLFLYIFIGPLMRVTRAALYLIGPPHGTHAPAHTNKYGSARTHSVSTAQSLAPSFTFS